MAGLEIDMGGSFETFNIDDLITAADVGKMGEMQRQAIIRRTARGESATGAAFKAYSKSYAEETGKSTVDLTVTGAMMGALKLTKPKDTGISITIKGKTPRVVPDQADATIKAERKAAAQAKARLRRAQSGKELVAAQKALARARKRLGRARTPGARANAQREVKAAQKRIRDASTGRETRMAQQNIERVRKAKRQVVGDYAWAVNARRRFMGITPKEADALVKMGEELMWKNMQLARPERRVMEG